MNVSVIKLIESQRAETVATSEYVSSAITIVDKLTITNTTENNETVNVYLVPNGGSVGDDNAVMRNYLVQKRAVELSLGVQGHVLDEGDAIWISASTADALTIRASGRLISES